MNSVPAYFLNAEGKMCRIKWCDYCKRPLKLQLQNPETYVLSCGTPNCKGAGPQLSVKTNKMNGAVNKAKAMGLFIP